MLQQVKVAQGGLGVAIYDLGDADGFDAPGPIHHIVVFRVADAALVVQGQQLFGVGDFRLLCEPIAEHLFAAGAYMGR